MRVIAYTYDADMHCVCCTRLRFAVNSFEQIQTQYYGATHIFSDGTTEQLDENLIPYDATDDEGNKVHAVFDTDELNDVEYCGGCHEVIYEAALQ